MEKRYVGKTAAELREECRVAGRCFTCQGDGCKYGPKIHREGCRCCRDCDGTGKLKGVPPPETPNPKGV